MPRRDAPHTTPAAPESAGRLSRPTSRIVRRLMRRFGRDEDGSMIVFTLFLILMMLLMGGIAVDMMRFENNRTRLQGAIDRAVLAAADLDVCLDPSRDPVAVVQDYVAVSGFAGQVGNIQVQRGFNSCQVSADARIEVNTIFMKMVNVDQLAAPATSAATESLDEVEVSLVLDVSGSMGRDGRIEALRPAASEFVESVLDSIEDGHATISIVPYDTQVNIGPDMFAQYLTRYNHTYSYCLDLPSNLYSRTDIPLQTRYDQAAHFDADSGYNSSSIRPATRFACNPRPSAWVLPFQDDVGTLQTYINALQPNEWTSIEMGAKWGVALLDPGTRDVTVGLVGLGRVEAQYASRPLDYNTDQSLKVLVLMTDGENTRDYVMSNTRRQQVSDIWFQDRSGTNERFFVDQQEVNDTDRDNRLERALLRRRHQSGRLQFEVLGQYPPGRPADLAGSLGDDAGARAGLSDALPSIQQRLDLLFLVRRPHHHHLSGREGRAPGADLHRRQEPRHRDLHHRLHGDGTRCPGDVVLRHVAEPLLPDRRPRHRQRLRLDREPDFPTEADQMSRPLLAPLGRHIARFARDERGNGTIEFVLFVPFFLMLFLSTFEMGMLMVRQTMLDRGLDFTVRIIGLNLMVDASGDQVVNRANISRSICFFSGGMIPDCTNRLRVEMVRANPHNWNRLPLAPDCVNVDEPAEPVTSLTVGTANELMFIRACALFDPYAPTAGLGAGLQRQTGDLYAMFATSAFVVEP